MEKIENENIIKLIIICFNLANTKLLLNKTKNKYLAKVTLRLLNYKLIFKSLERTIFNLNEHSKKITSLILFKNPIDKIQTYKIINSNIISASHDATIKVWDVDKGTCIKTTKQVDPVQSLIILPNSDIVACYYNIITVFNTCFEFTRSISIEGYKGYNKLVCLSERLLACVAVNKMNACVLILDYLEGYKCIKFLNEHTNWISSLVTINENTFATGSYDTMIKLWNIDNDFKCINTLVGYNDWIISLLFIEKGNLLLAGILDGNIKVWDIRYYCCVSEFKAHYYAVNCLLFLRNGYFASGCFDGFIKVWDTKDFQCINVLKEHDDEITALVFLDDYSLVSASNDKTIVIWKY
jgi:WD40 repeat protein